MCGVLPPSCCYVMTGILAPSSLSTGGVIHTVQPSAAAFFALTEIAAPSQRLKRCPKGRTSHVRLRVRRNLIYYTFSPRRQILVVSTSPCIIWVLTSVQIKPSKTESLPEQSRRSILLSLRSFLSNPSSHHVALSQSLGLELA